MGFMGMVFGAVAIFVLVCLTVISVLFFILAIVFKVIGKIKDKKGLKIAGTVFIVLGTLFILPDILITGAMAYNAIFINVELPDGGHATVTTSDYSKLVKLAEAGDESSVEELDHLLDKSPNLIYVRDANMDSVLEIGLDNGNSEVVRVALEHGSVFDDPAIYDNMAYYKTSMEDFLGGLIEREITEDDVRIVEMMFEEGAATTLYRPDYRGPCYTNIFGEAVWCILYNDGDNGLKITDTELEFLQVFIDNGEDSDAGLHFVQDMPSNYLFPDSYYGVITRDDNYETLMDLTGMED